MSKPAPPTKSTDSSLMFTNESTLRSVLKKALAEALAPTLGISLSLAAGCGDEAFTPRSEICARAASSLGCTSDYGLRPKFDQLTPAEPVDQWIVGWGQPSPQDLQESCKDQADPQECETLVKDAVKAALPENPPCLGEQTCRITRYVATRSGKQVRVWTTSAQLAKLLAPVETAAEADFIARFFTPMEMKCEDKRMGVWCEGDSFSVVGFSQTCSTFDFVLNVKVPHDGSEPTTKELARKETGCVIGRLPDACVLTGADRRGWPSVAAFLTECAALEAASVPAFMLLADDLRRLGAPAQLVAAAIRSAADEARHAAMVSGLAHSHGGAASLCVQVPSRAPKSLFEMALENAVEGCVRETYGALVGAYQAATAQNVDIRATISQLVQDELRHASLSFAIWQWAGPQLSHAERQLIASGQRAVIEALRAAASVRHGDDLYSEAGYPETSVALGMLDTLEQELWSSSPVAPV